MRLILCCCFLVFCFSFASASDVPSFPIDLVSITSHASDAFPLYGFDDKDFLFGSFEAGSFSYMYNDVLYFDVECDTLTHQPTCVQIRLTTKDLNQFLNSTSACVDIAAYSTGVDSDSIAAVFNDLVHSMYIQNTSFIVDGYVFNILYYDCVSPYEIRFDFYPDDGSYVAPKKNYCTDWSYYQLSRYPEYYVCERYSVRGKIQAIDGSRADGYTILLSSPSNSNNYFYVYINSFCSPSFNLLLGDNVTFKCIFGGDYRYKTSYGNYTTLPILFVEDTILHK